jgi:hypothetical protein
MPRVPQVLITLAPDGSLVAEFPTTNGLRRHVPISEEFGIQTIHRILAGQISHTPSTIGLDAKPTIAQVRHWSEHLDQSKTSDHCPWCIAASLGIDTTERAYKRAVASLQAQRKASRQQSQQSFHRAGDGSVKVYTKGPSTKAKPVIHLDLQSLLTLPED